MRQREKTLISRVGLGCQFTSNLLSCHHNYFFPFWLFEICFRLRFDNSHLRSLWVVVASWRARWPGSQILILPMLMLMWPILILILIWPILIYIDVTDIDIDFSFSKPAPESLSCTTHKRPPLHLLYTQPGTMNFFVAEWRIENECIKLMKHLTKYTVRDSISWYWVSIGLLCLYIVDKVDIWLDVTNPWHTHSLTDDRIYSYSACRKYKV